MRTQSKITLSLIAILLIISIILQANFFLAWNVSWLFHITQSFIAGGNYVTHFLATQSPILIYEFIPAALLSKWTGLPPTITVRLLIYIIGLASLWLCYKVSESLFLEKDRWDQSITLVVLTIIYFILPAMAFGEYQHLALLLTLPYFFHAALLLTKKEVAHNIAIWTGIFAGIGLMTDISFLLLFIATELLLAYKHRSKSSIIRTDTLTILIVIALYLMAIMLFTPNYIYTILPILLSVYTPAINTSWHAMIFNSTLVTTLLITAFFPYHYKHSTHKMLLSILFIAMIFSYFIFFLLRKTWYFYMIPTLAFSLLVLTFYLIEDMKNIRHYKKLTAKTEVKLLVATIIVYALIIFFPLKDIFVYNRASFNYSNDSNNEIHLLINYVKQHAQGKSIFVFNLLAEPGASLANYANVKLSNKILGFWMLPGILKKSQMNLTSAQQTKFNQARKLMFNSVVSSFQQYKPTLVIIQTENANSILKNNQFSYIQYFSQDPRFKEIWKHYHFVHQINSYAIYVYDISQK